MNVLSAFRRTFSSLGNRNYRFFFVGQTVSSVGTWMQRVAQDWLILELGGGPVELSIGVGLQSAPALLLSMWGGVIADRAELRRIMLWTQSAFALLSIGLGVLTLSGTTTIWMVYVFAFTLGCINVIDKPARQSFVLEMVDAEGVPNAISLNSSINNASRLVGPAVAGLVIAVTNTGAAFLINAATFVAILIALLAMDASKLVPRTPAPRQRGQVMEGLRYSIGDRPLRVMLLATLIVSTLAQNFRVLLPVYASEVFGNGAGGYGFLMSALGLGALIGALACANMTHPTQGMVMWSLVGFGLVLVVAAFAPTYLLLAVVMVGVGAGNTSFNTTSQSFLLLRSHEDKRGRVMALRQMFSNSLTPVGSVLVGWICEVSNPRNGFFVAAGSSLFTGAWIWRTSRVHPAQLPVLDPVEEPVAVADDHV